MLALMAFGAPIFAKLTGASSVAPWSFGIAADWLVGKPGWASYVPVQVDSGGSVRPVEHFCSTYISSLVAADGYVHVGGDRPRIAPGETVRIFRLP